MKLLTERRFWPGGCVQSVQKGRRHQMYYRVAIQVDAAPAWQWKSTVLSSLDTLFHFLRLFRALPHDQLRVFSSSSREGLAEQLEQENQGAVLPFGDGSTISPRATALPTDVRCRVAIYSGQLH